jgi:ADP-ribosyl-[dinitrogen reductase] hydrolase
MLGAIIGDIVGSRFEFDNHKSKKFSLFTGDCFATDDSIMTLAVAKAMMETEKEIGLFVGGRLSAAYLALLGAMAVKHMREIGQKYPGCGYGSMFIRWMFHDNPQPYDSFGNGAAMRVSPAGFAARSRAEAVGLSRAVTDVTHNHLEGIKGAEAVSVAIFMARHGSGKAEIREEISRNYYPLDFTADGIRATYEFDGSCQGTVPQAIVCFLESSSFEDAIRTAVSIGGDSDTLAAITGGIAEAFYGVPAALREKALTYLDGEQRGIFDEWEEFAGRDTFPSISP